MSSNTTTQLPDLAPSELALMQALWRDGALAARELHERVGLAENWAYTTTRTVAERLVQKRLIEKRRLHGLIVYAPAVSRARGLARRVLELADRVLLVDRAQVVSLLGNTRALTPQDLNELRGLLEAPAPAAAKVRR